MGPEKPLRLPTTLTRTSCMPPGKYAMGIFSMECTCMQSELVIGISLAQGSWQRLIPQWCNLQAVATSVLLRK